MATAAGIPTVIASGLAAGAVTDACAGTSGRHAVHRGRQPLFELQAVAEVRQARPRARRGRCGRGSRASRGRHESAAGRGDRGRRRFRCRRRDRDRIRRGDDRQGHQQLHRPMSCAPVRGLKSVSDPGAAAATRARRRFTATTSCSRNLRVDGNDDHIGRRDLRAGEARVARARDGRLRRQERGAAGDRRRADRARARDPRGERARPAERARGRAERRAARPARARRAAARRGSRTALAGSPRCRTRSAR